MLVTVDSEEFTDKLVIDVSVTNPLTVTVVSDLQPTLSDAQTPGIATNNPYNRKWNHYAKILEDLRDAPEGSVEKLGVLPFILTTSGFIHEKSLTLLRDLAIEVAKVHEKPYEMVYHRFKKLVACVLQRALAFKIHKRNLNNSSFRSKWVTK